MGKKKKRISSSLISKRGFTLIEIMATFVLIAIILPVAMEGIAMSTRMSSESRRKTEAGTLAEKKLTEILVAEEWSDGDQNGDFGDEYPGFTWRLEVNKWEKKELMRQIDLYVEWTVSKKIHSVVVTTLVYLDENENTQNKQ